MPADLAGAGYVMLGRQTGRGAPVALTGAHAMRVTSSSLNGVAEMLDFDEEIGNGRDALSGSAFLGGFRVEGDLEGLLRTRTFPLLLMGAGFTFGAPVQDGVTGAYTHPMTDAPATYLTVETSFGANRAVRRFSDVLVNELTISLEAGGKGTFSASCIGRTEAWQAAPTTPTFETTPAATWDASAITLDGLGTYRWESIELSIANNLSDDEWTIGARTLEDVTPMTREVTLGGTIKVGNNSPAITDLYRAAVYGSKTATGPGATEVVYHSSASLVVQSGRLIGTSTTHRFGYTFTAPDLVLTGVPLDASGNDRLTVDLEGRVLKGAGDIITGEVRNDVATGYTAATG